MARGTSPKIGSKSPQKKKYNRKRSTQPGGKRLEPIAPKHNKTAPPEYNGFGNKKPKTLERKDLENVKKYTCNCFIFEKSHISLQIIYVLPL